jgi:hypothetical protein
MVRLEYFKPEMRSCTISTQFFLAVGTILYCRGIIAFLIDCITDVMVSIKPIINTPRNVNASTYV